MDERRLGLIDLHASLLLLALDLRLLGAPPAASSGRGAGWTPPAASGVRTTAVIALAYPAAAWLSLAHAHSAGAARIEPGASALGVAAPQSHAHGAGDLLALLPGIAVLALIAALLAVSVRAARR